MIIEPIRSRLRFDLHELGDPDVACTFQEIIGRKFAPRDDEMDIDTIVTTYNATVTTQPVDHQKYS